MKGQLKVSTPAEYIAGLKEPRRSEIASLDALIRKNAPKLDPFIYSGMLGYGPHRYKYATGREGDGARIALASNENYISLYVGTGGKDTSAADQYQELLPKAKIGKSCVRFKRLSDLDAAALARVIRETAKRAAQR